MKRAVALAVAVLLVACGSSYDEAGYALVRGYVEEQVVAIDTVQLVDLSNPSDREQAAGQIDAINGQHLDGNTDLASGTPDGWPDRDDIEGWQIAMTRGDASWTIDGSDLWVVLADVAYLSGALADELRGDNRQELAFVAEDALVAAGDARTLMFTGP